MKERIPVTLSDDALAAVQARDLERFNAAAQRVNAEAEDVLEYQRRWYEDVQQSL
jgi:uncharacterized protein YydD (DUF2326 family)